MPVPAVVMGTSIVALLAITILPAAVGMGAQETQPGAALPPVTSLYAGQSMIVKSPWSVSRVSVTDPKIADVQMLTPNELLLQGKGVGSTDLILWSADNRTAQSRVDVQADLRQLTDELANLLPGSKLTLSQAHGTVVVSGVLARAEHAQYLESFMNSTGLQYVNMTSVAGVQQVQLKVRVAEVSRTALKMLGINAFMTGTDMFGGVTVGSADGAPINPISIGVAEGTGAAQSHLPFLFTHDTVVSSSVTLFTGFPEIGLELFLQALEENRYLRILAEPTLVALSGNEASFLAGGEYPIPIVQGSTVGAGTSITVEYKEFGVMLKFRPVVLGDNTIRLEVAPEVSQLSDVGAVTIQGFQIPSLLTRKAQTTLELHSGQTFALAGLISRYDNATSSRVPFMGNLPVLGALFRSVRYRQDETELLVLVTAALVEPMSPASEPPVPGFSYVPPNDWELYAMGMTEGEGTAKISVSQAEWLRRNGLDDLKGPGAWVDYNSRPAASRSDMGTAPLELDLDDAPAAEAPAADEDTTETTPQ
jgi:pilus assembly protein CpaC